MKKVLTLMLGLIVSTASFANQTTNQPAASETRVVMTTDHKLKLYVQPVDAKGKLAIRDANGQDIYNANVALQKGLHQAFDFSNLGIGTYQLMLKTGDQTVTKTFVVQAAPNTSFIVQES